MLDQALSGEPAPGGLCRVCRAPLDGASRCPRCGAVHGEGFRCPHCRAIADVERSASGRQRCKACGGPRLLLDDGKFPLSGRELPALSREKALAVQHALWRALGAGAVAFGVLSVALALALSLLFGPPVLVGALGIALSSLPVLFGLGALRRAQQRGRAREAAAREAEQSAARDLAEASESELTAADLARALRIDEQRAELLLAELSLDDVVRRRVTETGELAYAAPPRLRVTDELAPTEALEEEPGQGARAAREREGDPS